MDTASEKSLIHPFYNSIIDWVAKVHFETKKDPQLVAAGLLHEKNSGVF
jgi:hypothetical protein